MVDLIFWVVVIAYWAVGIRRLPIYFRRVDEGNRKNYPFAYKGKGMKKEAAWGALGLAFFWPYYEAGRWVQNTLINTMTAEERQKAEYEKAEKVVAEYNAKKEREEREAFDRELNSKP